MGAGKVGGRDFGKRGAMSAKARQRRVTILGSTGSVGCNTAELLAAEPELYAVEALVAQRNAERLAEQAKALKAKFAVVADESLYRTLKDALSGSGIEAAAGKDAVVEAARRPADWVMAAIVGAAGLAPTLAAVRRGVIVALANKEVMVCAGETERGKPYPDPFLAAAEQLGVDPARCMVFEDGDAGVQSAIAAGMKWVRVDQL